MAKLHQIWSHWTYVIGVLNVLHGSTGVSTFVRKERSQSGQWCRVMNEIFFRHKFHFWHSPWWWRLADVKLQIRIFIARQRRRHLLFLSKSFFYPALFCSALKMPRKDPLVTPDAYYSVSKSTTCFQMGHPRPLYHLFSVLFKLILQCFWQQINVKNDHPEYCAGILTHDL